MILSKLKSDNSYQNMIELGKRFIQCLCLKAIIYQSDGQKIQMDHIQRMCTDVVQTIGKNNKNDEQDFISWVGVGFYANDEEKRRQIQQYIESILKQIINKQSKKQLNLSSLQLQQNDAQAEKRRKISINPNKFQISFNQKDIKRKKKIDSYSRCLQQDKYAYPEEIDVSYYLNNKIKSKNTQLSVLCQQFGFIKTPWEQSKQDNMFIESISVMIESTETLFLKKRTVITEGKAKNKQTAKQLACHDALLYIYMNCPGVYSSMIDKKTKKAINT